MTTTNDSREVTQLIARVLHEENYPANYLHEITEYLGISEITSTKLTQEQRSLVQFILFKVRQQMPVEYIVGHAHFFEHKFAVTKDVLIPRPDTEQLVMKALALLAKCPQKTTIIDIGTGSGAIIISLAKSPLLKDFSAQFYALDISAAALTVAEQNAKTLGVAEKIQFLLGETIPRTENGTFLLPDSADVLIVTNPPYIAAKDMQSLPHSVAHYEPVIALQEQPNFLTDLQQYISFLREKGKKVHIAIEYSRNGQMIQRTATDLQGDLQALLLS